MIPTAAAFQALADDFNGVVAIVRISTAIHSLLYPRSRELFSVLLRELFSVSKEGCN